jgi:hypothetical protein
MPVAEGRGVDRQGALTGANAVSIDQPPADLANSCVAAAAQRAQQRLVLEPPGARREA